MSISPLIKVASSAFSNGSAIAFKKKSQQTQQPNSMLATSSPLKSTDENEQSPSKIINIYSDSALFNVHNTVSTVKNPPIIEEEKTVKTYSQMTPEEAEKAYCERQKVIKEQIRRTKNNGKLKPKKAVIVQKPTLKSALKKQQLDYSTAQSQQIDLSRTSQNHRRKSIDQPNQTIPKPHPQTNTSLLKQSFHHQLNSKKQQLLDDIAKLDKEIVKEKKPHSAVQSIAISPRVQQRIKTEKRDDMKATYEKRQQMKRIADQEKTRKEMAQCTFKPQISSTSRKLNTTQSSKLSPQTSPKQVKIPTRSQSQDSDLLHNSREELQLRIQRMNEKYTKILEQSSKLRTQLKQI